MPTGIPGSRTHGTTSTYWSGCRCQACKEAFNAYARARARRKKAEKVGDLPMTPRGWRVLTPEGKYIRPPGAKRRATRLSKQALLRLVAERMDEGLNHKQIQQELNIARSTVQRRVNEIRALRREGQWDPEKTRTVEFSPPDAKRPEELSEWARALVIDAPEAFTWFFDLFAPKMSEEIKGMARHSVAIVEAAYERCQKHPRIEWHDDPGRAGPEGSDDLSAVVGELPEDGPDPGADGDTLPGIPGPLGPSRDAGERHEGLGKRPWEDPDVVRRVKETAACSRCHWKKAVIVNIPPEHAKSTVLSVWMSIWRVAQDRSFRRIIISTSTELAQQFAGEIAVNLVENEDLVNAYGTFFSTDPRVRWLPSEGKIRVAGSKITRGYNILVRGMGSAIPGLRADEIVLDDAVDPHHVEEPKVRDKTERFFHNAIESRVGRGRIWVVGTRWHLHDLYGHLAQLKRLTDPTKPVWEHINIPAVLDWDTKQTLWPELWPFDRLMVEVRDHVGKAAFALTYQQQPAAPESVLALEEWVFGTETERASNPDRAGCCDRDRFGGYDRVTDGWLRVASFDPAQLHWAGTVIGDVNVADPRMFHFRLMHAERWTGGIREATLRFADLLGYYRVSDFVIEQNIAIEYERSQDFQQMLRSRGTRIHKHRTGVNKLDRQIGVMALGPDFEMGRIRLPYASQEDREMSGFLIKEATTYPMSDTTDVLMALWFIKVALKEGKLRLRSSGNPTAGARSWTQQLPAASRGKSWVRHLQEVH